MKIKTKVNRAAKKLYDCASYINSNMNDVLNEALADTYKETANDVELILMSCVDKFYDSYTPRSYDRIGGLYEAIHINLNKDGFSYETDSKYMISSHRADNEYIYWLAFEKGYHGGATTIDESKVEQWGEHPHPGSPYYRTNYFRDWGEPAKTTIPIEFRIQRSINEYKKSKQMQKHFNFYWDYYLTKTFKNSGIKNAKTYIYSII